MSIWLLFKGRLVGRISSARHGAATEHMSHRQLSCKTSSPVSCRKMEESVSLQKRTPGFYHLRSKVLKLNNGDNLCRREGLESLKTSTAKEVYDLLLRKCSKNGEGSQSTDRCVQRMEKHSIKKIERTYAELIKLSVDSRDLNAVEVWWRRLSVNGTPSQMAWCSYVVSLCRLNELTPARQALSDMVSACGSELMKQLGSVEDHSFTTEKLKKLSRKLSTCGNDDLEQRGISPQAHEAKSLADEELCAETRDEENFIGVEFMVDDDDESPKNVDGVQDEDQYEVLLFSKKDITVPGYPQELSSREIKLSDLNSACTFALTKAYTAMIFAAGKAKDHVLAEALFSEMRLLGLKMSLHTYHALLRAVLEGRDVNHGLRILKRMALSGTKPDVYCLTALMEAYCRKRSFKKAEAVLDYMENGSPSQHPSRYSYNILLKACLTREYTEGAMQVLDRMKQSGVGPDICTYIALFTILKKSGTDRESNRPSSRQELAKNITAVELDMFHSGVRHTPNSFNCLLHVLGEHGLSDMMLRRLEKARRHRDDLLDVTTYNTVLRALVFLRQVDTAWNIYEQMQKSGVKPNLCTFNILINSCTHERKLTTAFMLVDTLRQKGLTADVFTFNALLKVIRRSGKVEIAFDLLKEMASLGVQPNSDTCSIIHSFATSRKLEDSMLQQTFVAG